MTQATHEALFQLPRETQIPLLYLIEREREYEGVLKGVASCATAGAEDCVRRAREVLDKHGVRWGFAQLKDADAASTHP